MSDENTFVPVSPRVVSSELGESSLLVDVVESLIDSGTPVVARIRGCGKTIALQSIVRNFAGNDLVSIQDTHDSGRDSASAPYPIVYIRRHSKKTLDSRAAELSIMLAPWGIDELIEYLLANHSAQCSSVMARIVNSQADFAEGSPFVWQPLLELLASEPSIESVADAVIVLLETELERHAEYTLDAIADGLMRKGLHSFAFLQRLSTELSPGFTRILRVRDVCNLVVAGRIASRLSEGDQSALPTTLHPGLTQAVACIVASQPRTLKYLAQRVGYRKRSAVIVSLLVNAQPTWKPQDNTIATLKRAQLQNAKWAGCKLRNIDFSSANLQGSDLSGCDLNQADCTDARMQRCNLRSAKLIDGKFLRSQLQGADVGCVDARACNFCEANLRNTNFANAHLTAANFDAADLTKANLANADCQRADFKRAIMTDVDLRSADLRHADLRQVDMRTAELEGALFDSAKLWWANFEDTDLARCSFRQARMRETLLTGSKAKGVSFQGAILAQSGMAEIEWLYCDLRDVDLRNVAFHMGSTRCGLVGSPFPSHGTRTGFYTDDSNDLSYKQPEEIRKACLIGCDLRGAKMAEVDFYLVDLRGAKYDKVYHRHLLDCGAILDG